MTVLCRLRFSEENALEFTLTLNHELNNVNNWLTLNRICINADKTKYMISSYRKLLHLTNIEIVSATIEETNNIKFLGIIFDKHLTYKNHVDVKARKISKYLGILFKLSKYLRLEIRKTLYYSLINAFLLYGIEVWHGTYGQITNKIFILQEKACMAIHNLPFNTHTTEYFKNANILKLTDLYESQITKHMFKCLNLNANILPRHSDIHNYATRNNNKFIAPKCNMKKSELSIKFKSIEIWNKPNIRTLNSLNVFVDNLRNYLLPLTELSSSLLYFFVFSAIFCISVQCEQ